MKRLLFSVIALIIMGGYMFAQNKAYVQQIGGSWDLSTGVSIVQTGDHNLVTGPGNVPPTGHNAALLEAQKNILFVTQTGNYGTGDIKMTVGTSGAGYNYGNLIQWSNNDNAEVKQVSTESNTFWVGQFDNANLEATQNTGDGANSMNVLQFHNGAAYPSRTNNALIKQKTDDGDNDIIATGSVLASLYVFPGPDWGADAGIYQEGQNNNIQGFDGGNEYALQNSKHGDNHFTAWQYGSDNSIRFVQDAKGDNSADVYQSGDFNTLLVRQDNSSSNSLLVRQDGSQFLNVDQTSVTGAANTAIIIQTF